MSKIKDFGDLLNYAFAHGAKSIRDSKNEIRIKWNDGSKSTIDLSKNWNKQVKEIIEKQTPEHDQSFYPLLTL